MNPKLIYHGELQVTPPFSNEEVNFLNTWQNILAKEFLELDNVNNAEIKNQHYDTIKSFIGLPLDEKQLWLLHFAFNPLIKFETDKIIIEGEHTKGQLRDALLMYQHFFFSKDAFLKKYLPHLNFLNEHTFNGIIQAEKYSYKSGYTQWCYLAEKSEISSVDATTINEYLANPSQYPKEIKEDRCWERINTYYPKDSPLMQFLALSLKLEVKNNYVKKAKI